MKLIAEIKGTRQEFELKEGEEYIVGRDISCDITLQAGSISRRHVEIKVEAGEISARDLGSKNGTFFRGERIQIARIKPGDKLNIGHVLVEFAGDLRPGASAAPSKQAAPVIDDDGEGHSEVSDFYEDPTPTPLDESFIPEDMKEEENGDYDEGERDKTPDEARRQSMQLQKVGEYEQETAPHVKSGPKILTRKEKLMFLLPAVAVVLIMLLVIIISGMGDREEELVLSRRGYNEHIDRAAADFADENIEASLGRLEQLGNYTVEGDPQTHRILITAIRTQKLLHEPESFELNWRRGRELWEDVQNYDLTTEKLRHIAVQQIAWIARESRNMALYKQLAEELDAENTEDALQTAAEIPRDSMFFELAHKMAEGLRDEVVNEFIRQAARAEEAQDWEQAIELYRRAEHLSPEEINVVTTGLARANKFRGEENRIERASQLIDEESAQDAIRLLADIDADGPYHARAEELRLRAGTIQERRRAVSLYNNKNAAGAMAILEEAGLAGTDLYRKIEDVREAWDRVEGALARNDFSAAEAAGRTIINLETSRTNRYRTDARELLDTLSDRARAAARARRDEGNRALEAGRLSEARDKYEEAIGLDPDSQIGRAQIESLRREAVRRFNEALNMERSNPNQALEIYKDIRAALRMGDPYYERTLDAIERLERD